MVINTRIMTDDDLDRVCELEEKSFSMPWKREDFKDMIERDDSHYMVITLDGLVIGTAGYTYNGFEGYINNVVIDSDYRGNGYSRILLESLLEQFDHIVRCVHFHKRLPHIIRKCTPLCLVSQGDRHAKFRCNRQEHE